MIAQPLEGLAAAAAVALITWMISVAKKDASVVDTVWSVMILAAGFTYGASWLLALATVWALRLSLYITWRNWGEPEDRRYQAIRRRNEPAYALKSLYLVFGLQALLAWIVSAPLLAAAGAHAPERWLEFAGAALAVFGIAFETVADLQIARWRARRPPRGAVFDGGLWRYSRHPNYFGELCVWWGFGLVALASGAWWAMVSPLLVTVLLLRVSGVPLLERDLHERKPGYRDYSVRTNAFVPGPPRSAR
jgi:steroid 5-alpha reductase family enzyme